MAGNKYLSNNNGLLTEVVAAQTTAGAADAGKIVALDSTGRLDNSLLPTGIGADTASIVASEALAAGDMVNIWSNAGTANVRKADASSSGKDAHGFVLSAVSSGGSATVFFEGTNTAVTGIVPGVLFLSATAPGKATATSPSGSGQISQRIGFGTSSTAFNFQSEPPVLLA